MYEEIKKNIIDRFLNTHYLWTCCTNKKSLISDMSKRIPFDVKYICFSDHEELEMNLGNDVKIVMKLKWEEHQYKNTFGKDIIKYRLISIS
jgi:hypothetical protein